MRIYAIHGQISTTTSSFIHICPAKWIDKRYEKTVLKECDSIITVGASLKKMFSAKVKGVESKTTVITNGYDEEDFAGITALSPSLFTITYVGTLSDLYPIEGFLDALQVLKEKGHEYLLRFIGTVSKNQKELIQSVAGDSKVQFIPYVEHSEAIMYMMRTSVSLLIIPDHSSNNSIITGKLFEYLAAGKPIICLGPIEGDAAGIISGSRHGNTFAYKDSNAIAEYLDKIISMNNSIPGMTSTESYSRKGLAGKIIPLLNEGKS